MRCTGDTILAVLPAWSSPDQARPPQCIHFFAGEVGMKKIQLAPAGMATGRLPAGSPAPVAGRLVKKADKLGLCSCISVLDGKVGDIDINNVEKMIGGTGNFV